MRIVIPPEAPPREQSRLVIFCVTVVLVLGLIVAAFSLRDLGADDPTATPVETGVPLPTSTPSATTADPTPTGEPSDEEPTPTTAEAVPVELDGIRAIDPQGDGDEDSAAAPKAVDGDRSTSWGSQTYRSRQFGGLKKGVGLSLKLRRSATLSSVTIDVSGSGGAVELRTADGPNLESSTVVDEGSFRDGRITLEPEDAGSSRYVILWFTELPSVNGDYTIEVSEVRLK